MPNKKYAVDLSEGLDISNSDSDKGVEPSQLIEDNSDDADFSAEEAAAAEVEDENENESIVDDASDGSAVATPFEEHQDTASPVGSENEREAPKHRSVGVANYTQLRYKKRHPDSSLHSRGMPEVRPSDARESYLKTLYGTGVEDLEHIIRSRDQWVNEVTLPRRSNDDGRTGMRRFFSHTEDKREMEATVGWDWYYERGRDLFAKKQRTRTMSDSEGEKYLHKPTKSSHSVLLGPYGKQKLFHLSHLESLELGEAWEAATADGSEGAEHERLGRKEGRAGWLLNVGTNVRCLDWAPNHDGDLQYLAIATSDPKSAIGTELHEVSPAFTPSPPLPSCIQIWALSSSVKPGHEGLIESRTKPQLRYVICSEWGPIKYVKWCPMPRRLRDEESLGKASIGLLAGVCGDGCMRVLDVQMGKDSYPNTSYGMLNINSYRMNITELIYLLVKYDEACFTARPSNTLCTSLTWLSATDIAVGCANGFVSIYDVSGLRPSPNPWFHMPLHQTYILAVVSAYPSFPHLLATSSMDGYLRLTDLRSPQIDHVLCSRARVPPTTLVYSDPLYSIIASEETDHIRAYPLRRFFSSLSFAHCPGVTLALSAGHCHPTVVAGCADGSLVAVNPMRRVLYRKEKQYQQTVFRHEWARSSGVVRITEGYKVEMTNMTFAARKRSEGIFVTIHEEESAVTQACWNPNLACGGWVAVGMGSGLVRIEDLAI